MLIYTVVYKDMFDITSTFRACEKPDWYTELRAISHKSQALSFQTWKIQLFK